MIRIIHGLVSRPSTSVALLVILAVLLAAALAPLIAPFSPDAQPFDGLSPEGAPLPPDARYWLGTDPLGRDLLSRLLFGAHTSLIIGVVANGVAVPLARPSASLQAISAAYRQSADALHRPDDGLSGAAAGNCARRHLHPSLWIVALVIAMVNWVQVARVVYTETRSLAERDFVLAERSLGAGHARILCRTLLPHLTADRAGLLDARHLDDSASRGDAKLSRRRRAAAGAHPGATSFSRTRPISSPRPGWCSSPARRSSCSALSFNLVGDALRDILDPTQQGPRLMPASIAAPDDTVPPDPVWGLRGHLPPALTCPPIRPPSSPAAAPTPQRSPIVRHELGLDLPLPVQFADYFCGLLHGDLGRSYLQRSEVATLIWCAPAGHLSSYVGAISCELALGLTAGILAAHEARN